MRILISFLIIVLVQIVLSSNDSSSSKGSRRSRATSLLTGSSQNTSSSKGGSQGSSSSKGSQGSRRTSSLIGSSVDSSSSKGSNEGSSSRKGSHSSKGTSTLIGSSTGSSSKSKSSSSKGTVELLEYGSGQEAVILATHHAEKELRKKAKQQEEVCRLATKQAKLIALQAIKNAEQQVISSSNSLTGDSLMNLINEAMEKVHIANEKPVNEICNTHTRAGRSIELAAEELRDTIKRSEQSLRQTAQELDQQFMASSRECTVQTEEELKLALNQFNEVCKQIVAKIKY